MATDGELLRRYAADPGAEEAFRQVVERHGPMVLAACRRQAGEAAEDAVQAVFLLLARKARSLAGESDVGPWLHRAAGFVAGRARREEERRRSREKEAAAMRQAAGAVAGDPGTEAARRELAAHLDVAVGELSESCRQAVVLCYLEGASQAEAARRLGLPLGTVADRCARGLSRLRERLARRGVPLGAAALGSALLDGAARSAADFAAGAVLSSVMAASKTAAGLSAAGAAGSAGAKALALAEGAMKAMFWMKVKVAAAVIGAVVVAGGGGGALAVRLAAGEPGAGSPKAEVPAGEKPAPAEAGKVAWGEAANGLQAGLIPLGDGAAKGWQDFVCPECLRKGVNRIADKQCPVCGSEPCTFAYARCPSCAAAKRICQGCGAAKPAGGTFAEGEPLACEIHVKSVAGAALQLSDAGYAANWLLEIKNQAGGQVLRPQAMFDDSRAGPLNISLDKQKIAVTVRTIAAPGWKFRADGGAGPIDALPPGKYAVTASYEHAKGHPEDRPCPYWHGKVATGAVEIEVQAKGAAAPAGAPDAAAAVRLAREFLAKKNVQPVNPRAFPLPPPVADWWLVEYQLAGGLMVSPGPCVYVNKTTGEVSELAPKGMPARM